jgi:hypothetical protein
MLVDRRAASCGWQLIIAALRRRIVITIGSLTLLALMFSLPGAGQASVMPANELVRRVLANELKAENEDHRHWMFRLQSESPDGTTQVEEVIQTKNGELKRPIMINGGELTAGEQRQADQRIQQLIHNPGALRKSAKEKNEDAARGQRRLKMLPDAFLFNYGERRGDIVQLNFEPDPHFKPHTRESQVFHAMEGTIWLDTKQNGLAHISGHLSRELKFGGGLFGHLDKAGVFDVKQAEVAPGYWELTFLNVQMKGKALFFKTIGAQQKFSKSDFKLMPDDLTIAQPPRSCARRLPRIRVFREGYSH